MNPLPFFEQALATYTLIGLLLTLATISNTKVDDEDCRTNGIHVLCLFLGCVWPIALVVWFLHRMSKD